jgi:hypothetical protein
VGAGFAILASYLNPFQGSSMKTKARALAVAIGMFCAASGFAQNAVTTAVGKRGQKGKACAA